jgi:hypothetical protein
LFLFTRKMRTVWSLPVGMLWSGILRSVAAGHLALYVIIKYSLFNRRFLKPVDRSSPVSLLALSRPGDAPA